MVKLFGSWITSGCCCFLSFPLAWMTHLFVCGFLVLLFLHCCFGFFLCWESSSGKLPELVLEENIMRRMKVPDGDVRAVLFQEHTTV